MEFLCPKTKCSGDVEFSKPEYNIGKNLKKVIWFTWLVYKCLFLFTNILILFFREFINEKKRKKSYECEFCPYKSPKIQLLDRHVRSDIG